MRKFKPIEIKEYRPLTELEMKNVFGGSGDFTVSGNTKCAEDRDGCTAFAFYRTSQNGPLSSRTLTGTCQTLSGTMSGPGTSGIEKTSCECVITDELPSGTTSLSQGIPCSVVSSNP